MNASSTGVAPTFAECAASNPTVVSVWRDDPGVRHHPRPLWPRLLVGGWSDGCLPLLASLLHGSGEPVRLRLIATDGGRLRLTATDHILQGFALLKGLRARTPPGTASIESEGAAPWEAFRASADTERPAQALLNPLVDPLVNDAIHSNEAESSIPIQERSRRGTCALALTAAWLVLFGTVTTGLSVWGFFS